MRQKLQEKYRRLCPYGEKRLNQLVEKDIAYIIFASILAAAVLALWNTFFSMISVFYMVGCIGLSVFLVYHEISGLRQQRTMDVLHKEIMEYFSAVKHAFLSGKNIANAVIETAENFGEEIRLHAALLYRILSGGDRKEKVREYVIFTKYDRYLKLFLVQAYEASENGDVMLNEESSLFSDNLEHLRLAVMEELYYGRKKRYEYAGYLFVSLVPVLSMPLLRHWGLAFSPELETFYKGYGKLLEWLALFSVYVIYCFIRMAKELYSFEEESSIFLFPQLKRWYQRRLLQEEAEHEIRQFQSVILMERRMADNTVTEILEDMEIFSHLFRPALRDCINSYMAGPEKALRRLRLEGGKIHPAFRELADGFLAVDEVGIRKAFAEVESNRERLEKMSRLEEEIRLERRKDGLDLISKVPMGIALGGYFIAPFFVVSLRGVYEVFSILSELQM